MNHCTLVTVIVSLLRYTPEATGVDIWTPPEKYTWRSIILISGRGTYEVIQMSTMVTITSRKWFLACGGARLAYNAQRIRSSGLY